MKICYLIYNVVSRLRLCIFYFFKSSYSISLDMRKVLRSKIRSIIIKILILNKKEYFTYYLYFQVITSFAQWRYHSRWGLSEAWLLLVENYTQYPAQWPETWPLAQFLTAPPGAKYLNLKRDLNNKYDILTEI